MTPEGRMGCLMVNSTMELAAEDSEVGEIVREAHAAAGAKRRAGAAERQATRRDRRRWIRARRRPS